MMDEEKGVEKPSEVIHSPKSDDELAPLIQLFWILVWMANNIMVTMLNKAAFATVDFKYPYALSAVHMACNILGAQIFLATSSTVKPKVIEGKNMQSIIFFSFIFSFNIAIGNTSLRWVSVSFNQMARSLVPVVAMILSIAYFKKKYSMDRRLAVIPIVLGVALTFYGDVSFTMVGVFYTVLCILLAALKVVVGGELLTGDLKLHEIDLLSKMCPLALIQVLFMSFMTGEISAILANWSSIVGSSAPQVLLFSGLLSFSLNICSFIANKVTSPLTLCISANVKQVLVVAISSAYFGDPINLVNALGICLVALGSYRYTVASIADK